uniref:Putative secreted protein n=1 Tax=Ixodes ricinus TaxID=34613 RepID=A0A6B0UIE4_IXORI
MIMLILSWRSRLASSTFSSASVGGLQLSSSMLASKVGVITQRVGRKQAGVLAVLHSNANHVLCTLRRTRTAWSSSLLSFAFVPNRDWKTEDLGIKTRLSHR